MKFIAKNQKDCDCAIVATFNALQWQNNEIPYETLEKIAKKRHGYKPNSGFPNVNLRNFFTEVGLSNRKPPHATIGQLESHILRGNAVFLIYAENKATTGHAILALPGKDRIIDLINTQYTWIELVQQICRKEKTFEFWSVGQAA